MNGYKLTIDEKNDLMRQIIYMLYLTNTVEKNGYNIDVVTFVKNTEDDFLIFAFMLVVNGIDPSILTLVFNNFVMYEQRKFEKIKTNIQTSALLTMQHKNSFIITCQLMSAYTHPPFLELVSQNAVKFLKKQDADNIIAQIKHFY